MKCDFYIATCITFQFTYSNYCILYREVAAICSVHHYHPYNLVLHSSVLVWLATIGSVAEWLACWIQAQNGLGSNRSRDAVLGKLFTPILPLFPKQQNW